MNLEDFINKNYEEILQKNLNYTEIIKIGQPLQIKGLTNANINMWLSKKGIKRDKESGRWIIEKQLHIDLNPSSPEENPPDDFEHPEIKTDSKDDSPQKSEEQGETESPQPNENTLKQDSDASKNVENLSIRISSVEESIQKLLSKLSEIDKKLSAKPDKVVSNPSSEGSLNIRKYIELSYSSSKRYELTLREDLVNRAKEKLKRNPDLNGIDVESKASRLFEIILFDYINPK